jgi:hypothetical protein
MMAWIVVALLAVFSADAGAPSPDASANSAPTQGLDDGSWPPDPKP